MQKVSMPDALDAMEKNIRVFMQLAGMKPGRVQAHMDVVTGTASIKHVLNYRGEIDVDVFFPAKSAQIFLTSKELDRWTGYFIHELCHALYTDEHAWQTAVKERIHRLVNALEDVRIESKLNASGIVGNSRAQLNSLLEWVVDQLPASYNPNDLRGLPWLLAMVGRVDVCGYDLPGASVHMAKMGQGLADMVQRAMDEVRVAKDTNDVLVTARWIAASLAKAKTPTGTKTNPNNPPRDTGTKETGESDDVQSDDVESDDVESDDVESDGGQSDDGQSDDAASNNDPIDCDAEMDDVDLTPETAEEKAKDKANAGTSRAWQDHAINQSIRDAKKTAGKEPQRLNPQSHNVSSYLAEMSGRANRCATLRANVARVLKAEENESNERSRPSGRIDRHALTRIAAGNTTNVYARRTISGGYETEIIVLVDGSSSMAGYNSYYKTDTPAWSAATLAFVICQAANQVGVKSEVFQFPGFQAAKTAKESMSNKDVVKRIVRMGTTVAGCTPLTENIIQAATRLAHNASHKRKMLFVVTDGDCDHGPYGVSQACFFAASVGVEVVGLFIDMPAHKGFPHSVECSTRNIEKAGLGKLVQVLSRDA